MTYQPVDGPLSQRPLPRAVGAPFCALTLFSGLPELAAEQTGLIRVVQFVPLAAPGEQGLEGPSDRLLCQPTPQVPATGGMDPSVEWLRNFAAAIEKQQQEFRAKEIEWTARVDRERARSASLERSNAALALELDQRKAALLSSEKQVRAVSPPQAARAAHVVKAAVVGCVTVACCSMVVPTLMLHFFQEHVSTESFQSRV